MDFRVLLRYNIVCLDDSVMIIRPDDMPYTILSVLFFFFFPRFKTAVYTRRVKTKHPMHPTVMTAFVPCGYCHMRFSDDVERRVGRLSVRGPRPVLVSLSVVVLPVPVELSDGLDHVVHRQRRRQR